jgi:uroporphyrin-III C-methyltransferase
MKPHPASTSATSGHVIFVGAGPGSADLITLRGARALAQADVVLFDALTDPAFRDFAPQAQWVDVGKRGFCDAMGQTRINALLVAHAKRGGSVVRLKGGDPSIFGRLEEELQALAQHAISCDVVPGITAALAAAAHTQRPLTRRGRGRSVQLTTAMTRESSEVQVAPRGHPKAPTKHGQPNARPADTEVFYMAGRQLAALSRQLRAAGWADDTPTCVVSNAGASDAMASQHSLAALADAAVLHAGRPTVVTVGVGAESVTSPQHAGQRLGQSLGQHVGQSPQKPAQAIPYGAAPDAPALRIRGGALVG